MRSSGRFALLAMNSLLALAGGALMFVVVRATLDPAPPDRHEAEHARVDDPTPQSGRLAFVPSGAFSLRDTDLEDIETSPAAAPESEGTVPWSTETRAAGASHTSPESPPRMSPPSSFRLPWQTVRPGTSRRFYTLKARLAELSPGASLRLAARFEAAKAAWPPAEIVLIAIKDEKVLELHARPKGGAWKRIHRYRVLAASGGPGPKLRQGDRQVPEGLYSIAFLNPNSAYHVSLRVNYPNAFDRQMAAKEARKDLGGDIMIHGKNLSAGCLAMGDEAVEELFVLAAQTRLPNVRLIIAPTDLRENGPPPHGPGRPEWLPKLYTEIATAMAEFKQPRSSSGNLLSFLFK